MSVVRIEKNKNYTTMSNYHLRDKNLSLKAKGLLSVVLSLPDNWDYSIEGLVSILKEEKRAVKNAIEELVQNKYLIILKLKATKNIRKNIEYIYTFYEKPFNQKDLTKLLNSVNKEEIMKYDCGVNLDGIDVNAVNIDIHNVDTHNVYLQKDTQINKDIINKEYIPPHDNNNNININKNTNTNKNTNNNKNNNSNTNKNNNSNTNNINNTNINSNINNNKVIEDKESNSDNNLFDYIQNNFGRLLSPIEYEKISTWEDNKVTRHAVEVAILNNKHSISYVEGILRRYKDNDVSTLEQAKEYDDRLKNKSKGKETKDKTECTYPQPVETEPNVWCYSQNGSILTCSEPYQYDGKWVFKNVYGEIVTCKQPRFLEK